MTVLRLALAILALSAFARPALAERLVIAVSSDDIAVTSNFSGAGIAILGSIERDAQTVARRAGYDIVVVLRGPRETLVARRRERVGGIWVNRKSVHFPGAPSLYVVLTGKPLPLVAGEAVLRKNRIGLDMLGLEAFERLSQADEVAFRQAAVRLKHRDKLYAEVPGAVTMLTGQFFRSRIVLPANIRTGRYEATVYLFGDGALLSHETIPFYVGKAGFEATVSDLARSQPLIYGLIAVALALFTGWFGGVVFRRD